MARSHDRISAASTSPESTPESTPASVGEATPDEATPGAVSSPSWMKPSPVGAVYDAGEEEVLADFAANSPTAQAVAAPAATAPTASGTVRESASSMRQSEFERLFAQWRETGDPQLRDRLILMNRNLVSYLARKFVDRGEMSEDIVQQGLIGLINALDHFDPSRGVRFATFATPTIMGEIRRYFRDKTWGIRVPRRLQELNKTINLKIEDLTQKFDRSPTYAEIAASLDLSVGEIVEALEMVNAMEPLSIDEIVSGSGDETFRVGDRLGGFDPDIEGTNQHATLETALEQLPPDERAVLKLSYFDDKSQAEIAQQMQVSQMYVSRLQRKALARLRDLMNRVEL